MKITVLDGFSMNPGDLRWDALKQYGDVTVFDRTSPSEILQRACGAEILLTNKTVLTGDIIRRLPELRYIGVLATGFNIVDVKAARECGVTVCNVPAYSTMSVAQQAISLLLVITNHAERYAQLNREGEWSRCRDFCYWHYPLVELAGKQMGIVGYGHTGRATAEIARALGMRVAVVSSKPESELPGCVKMDMEQLFSTSDVVSLHCPLADDTFHLVNAERLSWMKPSAILINTSRGDVVDEQALADALNSGRIYAAGVDVLSKEPATSDNPLLSAKNCFVTPHIAWATKEARIRLMKITVENVAAFLNGNPQNVVN